MNFSKKFLEEVLNTIIVKVVSEMQRFVYFHAQFSPWVDLGRRALLALAKEKKNLQDMHGRYLLCKSRWVLGLKSCWNSQCARWKKVVLLDDVNAQFSWWKSPKNANFVDFGTNFQLWIFAPKYTFLKIYSLKNVTLNFCAKNNIFENSAT